MNFAPRNGSMSLMTTWTSDAVYDSEDPIIWLFCGHTGPAAAGSQDNDDKDRKHGGGKSKCTMYRLTKVTPQSWPWAMCVAWFSLCSCNSYRLTIGSFNLKEFFFAIIEALNDAENPWAVETLEWINEQVFGKHAAKATMAASNNTDSDLAKMWAKRTAHKQGATLPAATSNSVSGSAPPHLPPPKPTCKQGAPSTAATRNSVSSVPPRLPPPKPLTPATGNTALAGSTAAGAPPPGQHAITPVNRLPSVTPSLPLSLPPSPTKSTESAIVPSEPATTDNTHAALTDPNPPPTTPPKVVPKPRPARAKSSVCPTHLVTSHAQVDVEEPAPVIPKKKKAPHHCDSPAGTSLA
ncbi:hypothetical protein BDR04DRAFT_1178883 [Suillus decipiens]|nr:hypothetical protein BDR04DRAFT_1178883 [Suillus decipiens]